MEVPCIVRLQTYHRAALAIIGAMGFDDTHVVHAVILNKVSEHFADLLAASLFALLACTDVKQSSGCIFFLAHGV
jgi:hypothetical protein